MSRSRYISKQGKGGRKLHPSVEKLAAAIRKAGGHRMHRDLFEQRIGRSLTQLERRAFVIAQDSLSHQDSVKLGAARRYAAIESAGQIKHPTDAKGKRATRDQRRPIGIDAQGAALARDHAQWSTALPAPRGERNRWSDDFDPRKMPRKAPAVRDVELPNMAAEYASEPGKRMLPDEAGYWRHERQRASGVQAAKPEPTDSQR